MAVKFKVGDTVRYATEEQRNQHRSLLNPKGGKVVEVDERSTYVRNPDTGRVWRLTTEWLELVPNTEESDMFIVAVKQADGSVRPSHCPVIHSTNVDAVKEAMRLSEREDKQFVVFKAVNLITPPVKPKATVIELV